MAWLEKYRVAWEVFLGVVGAAIAWGVLYNTVSYTSALAEKGTEELEVHGNRLTKLETQYQVIDKSLDEIKQDLRGINRKLDRQ